ncbi:AMP-binding protein [Dyella silvatica]|uniref:AMP-binding protein n=1 Tax=Dyella silvatica TaxID=2992128 RepID=UPI002253CE63|nr:AMP-binding protein [Dyella silvatica]
MTTDAYQRAHPAAAWPLLSAGDPQRVLAWCEGEAISAVRFHAQVRRVAAQLPSGAAAVNLCENRYSFLVAFCAIALRGQANLLPPSRAPQAVAEVMAAHPGCYVLGEQDSTSATHSCWQLPALSAEPLTPEDFVLPQIPADQLVAIGYTSGSTGAPRANPKTWRSFHASNAGNLRMLQGVIGKHFHVVATVPPQHIYGLEMSVLLPLLGEISIHAGRPFFPADVAAALAEVPEPRVLVTTPVHLRALVASGVELPVLAAMVSATAPLPTELAWSLYDGVHLHPQPDGTLIEAPQLEQALTLADIVTLQDDGRRFQLRGRHADMLEIAGKRASLADLTRRLLAIPGVRDGVVLQLDEADTIGVRRIAALAVAPGLDEHAILAALRCAVDPVFLPRPLRLVQALPRNETGKLPRQALLGLLSQH